MAGFQHDSSMCNCDGDTKAAVSDTPPEEPTCECPCDKCFEQRQRLMALLTRRGLEERLRKANIPPDVFAQLLWPYFESMLEQRVRRIALDAVRDALRMGRVISRIEVTNLDDANEARK